MFGDMPAKEATFCPERETLKIRLHADIRVYHEAVVALQANIEEAKAHKHAERARLAYEVSLQKLNQHIASHGCG
jgi:hypothetical protein